MNECGGWRQLMPEDHSFFKRAWYIAQVFALGALYFVYAVIVGIWEYLKGIFKK